MQRQRRPTVVPEGIGNEETWDNLISSEEGEEKEEKEEEEEKKGEREVEL